MARWQPDAHGRLLQAALDLFSDQGYEATTAAQIAQRAGLTKTTLFRLFADKREILFQGQPALVAVAGAGIRSAEEGATPMEALQAALRALCAEHVPAQQEIGRRIYQIVGSSPELQERTAYKRSAITAALESALAERLADRRLAGVLADLGARAYYEGFAAWLGPRAHDRLADVVLDELGGLRRSLQEVGAQDEPARPRGGGAAGAAQATRTPRATA